MWRHRLNLGLYLAILVVQALSAQPAFMDELKTLTHQIQLLNLINGLELDTFQLQFIIARARAAAELQDKLINELQPYQSDLLNTLNELKHILIKGDPIPPVLKSHVHKVEHTIHQLQLTYYDSIAQLAHEVESILQPHQLRVLDDYTPCLIPPHPQAAGQVTRFTGIDRALHRIRQLPPEVFDSQKEHIAERMLDHIKVHLPMGYIQDESQEKLWLLSFIDEIYHLPAIDFRLKAPEYIEKLQHRYKPYKPSLATWAKIANYLLTPDAIPLLESKLQEQLK